MRADRLLKLLLLVERHHGLTIGALASALEVSRRTVERDIDALGAAGFPVYAERGVRGGVRLAEDYRVQLTGLREPEFLALLLHGHPTAQRELGWGTEADLGRHKVEASLSSRQQDILRTVQNRFYVDERPWFAHTPPAPPPPPLVEAVRECRVVEISYDKPGVGFVCRRLEPYGLASKVGVWYLVANREGLLRVYRVARIRDVRLHDERFICPPTFHLETFWLEWAREFEATMAEAGYPARLAVRESAWADFAVVAPWLTVDGALKAASGPRDGYVAVGLVFASREVACRHVAGFGDAVRVLNPPELTMQVQERARAALGRSG